MTPKQWTHDELVGTFSIRIRIVGENLSACVLTNAPIPPVGLPDTDLEAPSLSELVDVIEEWFTTQTPPTEPPLQPESDTAHGFRLRNWPVKEPGVYLDLSPLTPAGRGWRAVRVTGKDAPSPLTPPVSEVMCETFTDLLDLLKQFD